MLTIYKGFDKEFIDGLKDEPLMSGSYLDKTNVLSFDDGLAKKLSKKLLAMDEDENAWITYEEYALIHGFVKQAINDFDLKVQIISNNLYPGYYPIPFDMSEELVDEIITAIEVEKDRDNSAECSKFLAVYSQLMDAEGTLYGSFYNHEINDKSLFELKDYYEIENEELELLEQTAEVFSNESMEAFLVQFERIRKTNVERIAFGSTNGLISESIKRSLLVYCKLKGIKLYKATETTKKDEEALYEELKDLAKNTLGIKGFKDFRTIRFYKNPDLDKETIYLSQGQIIKEIIQEATKASSTTSVTGYRDIFVTASTGAGKSVMFQIPAAYIAKKLNKLTIIIEPVKALMQDQKEQMQQNGYDRVEAFNSDLITQVEREKTLTRVKNGEVDLLYLSPETLLSYSIEQIIGDRDIGLIIIDEAHIVTAWGQGFRPDYWYLGGYIDKLRNGRGVDGKKEVRYHFPVCAFTATAVNGGADDTVSDTITSLTMNNPIKHIGYARRDDISFNIRINKDGSMSQTVYEEKKCEKLNESLKKWLGNGEKSIVYFPFAKTANDMKWGFNSFTGITKDSRIGIYTGRNTDNINNDMFTQIKRDTFDKFRTGGISVMYATKAFGMGISVNDVKNVYHYAISGGLTDYVQEIGRAARREGMTGVASLDYYEKDMSFMKILYGMSSIRQNDLRKVLSVIYDIYRSKGGKRKNFLISPESFTYIFKGKDEDQCVNKLKTSLLMLEKDLYERYKFKVLISRPQSVFTKAFVVVRREDEKKVFKSKYKNCFRFVAKGRQNELMRDGSRVSDLGDIYELDLKTIWEEHYPSLSFPQFKFWYFNNNSKDRKKITIMPEIRTSVYPRQKLTVESRGGLEVDELSKKILDDCDWIADTLYEKFPIHTYFTIDECVNLFSSKYGKTHATLIFNNIFDLVDPNSSCVKWRLEAGKTEYTLSNGNFKEYLRKSIVKSGVVKNLNRMKGNTYSGYVSLIGDDATFDNVALKLLSIFDYASFEVAGGQEPEIFIRLNEPNIVKNIASGAVKYSNKYVNSARDKYERGLKIISRFVKELNNDTQRWNYIEDYFLGEDVLYASSVAPAPAKKVDMLKQMDVKNSYLNTCTVWKDLKNFMFDTYLSVVDQLDKLDVVKPEYLTTAFKKSQIGDYVIMSWPSKNVLIISEDTGKEIVEECQNNGWKAYRIFDIDYRQLMEDLA